MSIEEARDADEQDEEGDEEDNEMVFGVEEELGQRNSYVVAAGSVRVTVLLEVFVGSLIC